MYNQSKRIVSLKCILRERERERECRELGLPKLHILILIEATHEIAQLVSRVRLFQSYNYNKYAAVINRQVLYAWIHFIFLLPYFIIHRVAKLARPWHRAKMIFLLRHIAHLVS